MDTTPGGGFARSLREDREEILSATSVDTPAAAVRAALCELYESRLGELARTAGIREGNGFALLALGGLGRREVLPYSDLDLLLVHERRPGRTIGSVADALWYPLWDSGIGLDHSVRTVDQSLSVAASDVCAGLSLLDARVIAGDADLGALVVDGARRQWREQIAGRYDELVEAVASRRQRAGVIAHLTEPDLKNGAGGLRDVQLISALALAQLSDGRSTRPGRLAEAHRRVVDARTELHRISGRAREVLHAQYGDDVAAALGVGDRFDLARVIGDASRTIAFTADQALRDSCSTLSTRGLVGLLHRSPVRRPLADGVVEHSGEVALARATRVTDDPWLPLRVAAAAARADLPIASATLGVLAERAPRPEGIWPPEALSDLLVLLGSGPALPPVFEALDRSGLWERILPEWSAIRDLPARDRAHVFPVDRHLVQTAVEAAPLTTTVRRPDLLLLAALLHDIGKARPGDHSETGAEMVRPIAVRLGSDDDDVETLVRLVRHHLVFARASVGKDPRDPATAAGLAEALDDDLVALDVLAALTEADSKATGPTVWTPGRASAHAALAAACRELWATRPNAYDAPVVEVRRPHGRPDVVVVLTPHATGARYGLDLVVPGGGRTLEVTAQVLAFHGLDVIDARIDLRPPGGLRAAMTVATGFGDPVDPRLLAQDLRRAVDSGLPAPMRAALDRAARIRPGPGRTAPDPTAATAPGRVAASAWPRTDGPGVILEVRTHDGPTLLARSVSAVLDADARIDWARVRTRGAVVEDVFALSGPGATPATAGAVATALIRTPPA